MKLPANEIEVYSFRPYPNSKFRSLFIEKWFINSSKTKIRVQFINQTPVVSKTNMTNTKSIRKKYLSEKYGSLKKSQMNLIPFPVWQFSPMMNAEARFQINNPISDCLCRHLIREQISIWKPISVYTQCRNNQKLESTFLSEQQSLKWIKLLSPEDQPL